MNGWKDYYQILGVSFDATMEEIRKSYRKLARENHPDSFPGNKEKEELFKLINEAYNVLSDEEQRKKYNSTYEENKNRENRESQSNSSKETFNRKFDYEEATKEYSEASKRASEKIAIKKIISDKIKELDEYIEQKNNLIFSSYDSKITEKEYYDLFNEFQTRIYEYLGDLDLLCDITLEYNLFNEEKLLESTMQHIVEEMKDLPDNMDDVIIYTDKNFIENDLNKKISKEQQELVKINENLKLLMISCASGKINTTNYEQIRFQLLQLMTSKINYLEKMEKVCIDKELKDCLKNVIPLIASLEVASKNCPENIEQARIYGKAYNANSKLENVKQQFQRKLQEYQELRINILNYTTIDITKANKYCQKAGETLEELEEIYNNGDIILKNYRHRQENATKLAVDSIKTLIEKMSTQYSFLKIDLELLSNEDEALLNYLNNFDPFSVLQFDEALKINCNLNSYKEILKNLILVDMKKELDFLNSIKIDYNQLKEKINIYQNQQSSFNKNRKSQSANVNQRNTTNNSSNQGSVASNSSNQGNAANKSSNQGNAVNKSSNQGNTTSFNKNNVKRYMKYVKENLYKYVIGKLDIDGYTEITDKVYDMIDKSKISIYEKRDLKEELREMVISADLVESESINFADTRSYELYAKHILPIYFNEINRKVSNKNMAYLRVINYVRQLDLFSENTLSYMYKKELKLISNQLFSFAACFADSSDSDSLKNRCNNYFDTDISKEIPIWKTLKHILSTLFSKEKRKYFYSENININNDFQKLEQSVDRLYDLYELGSNLMEFGDNKKDYKTITESFCLIKRFINNKNFSREGTRRK